MSAGESESDSDVGELMGEVVEYPETLYVETPEDEFGAVSTINWNQTDELY